MKDLLQHKYDDIIYLKDDPTHECCHKGQGGRVWRMSWDGLLYCELNCGHPVHVRQDMIGVTVKLRADLMSLYMNERNVIMAKKSNNGNDGTIDVPSINIPAPVAAAPRKAKGAAILSIPGYEMQAKALQAKLATLAWLEDEADAMKEDFRRLARSASRNAEPGINSFAFEDGAGGKVTVSLNDPTKDGNRTKITPATIESYRKEGLDIAPHVETVVSYELRGKFVVWLSNLLKQWEADGSPIPDGLTEKSLTRLSVAGVQALTKAAMETDDPATADTIFAALADFIKTPSVKAK